MTNDREQYLLWQIAMARQQRDDAQAELRSLRRAMRAVLDEDRSPPLEPLGPVAPLVLRDQLMPCPSCGHDHEQVWRQEDDEDGPWVGADCPACGYCWDPAPFEGRPTVGEYAASEAGGGVQALLAMMEGR